MAGNKIIATLDLHGFKAKVWRDGPCFVATIRELHINTQGRSLPEIKTNLEECLELVKTDVLEKQVNKSAYSNKVVEEIKSRLYFL